MQSTLAGVAVLALGYTGFVLVNSWVFEHEAKVKLEKLLAVPPVLTPGVPPGVPNDGLIGKIEVERLGVSVAVMEGAGAETLEHAVGHIEGTALPGQRGNVGLAGHRDTFFRPLRNIRSGDIVSVTTPQGEYRYRVVSTQIVSPTDVSVLAPRKKETLTLVTCYPFYFVGSAPDRFIVQAERIPDSIALKN